MGHQIAVLAALSYVSVLGIILAFVCYWGWKVANERLFCGECGRITDGLTDDDVCYACDRKLAAMQLAQSTTLGQTP